MRSIEEFIVKTGFLTLFVGALLYGFFPRYILIDTNIRFDKISGKIEEYSSRSWDRGWHQK